MRKFRNGCRSDQGRKGHWMVSGADGIWPTGTGRTLHHWRCTISEDAGSNEPEDQVSGEFPAICAVGVARESSEYFELEDESPYMLLVAPVAKSKHVVR